MSNSLVQSRKSFHSTCYVCFLELSLVKLCGHTQATSTVFRVWLILVAYHLLANVAVENASTYVPRIILVLKYSYRWLCIWWLVEVLIYCCVYALWCACRNVLKNMLITRWARFICWLLWRYWVIMWHFNDTSDVCTTICFEVQLLRDYWPGN